MSAGYSPDRMRKLIDKNGGPTALGQEVNPNIISDQLAAGMLLNYQRQVVQWEAYDVDTTAWTITLGEFVTSGTGGIVTSPGYTSGAVPQFNNQGISQPAIGPVWPLTDTPVIAKVDWGSGGVVHTAQVDWPCRGGSFTVNGSFVRVTPVADFATFATPATPRLKATIGPATGGKGSAIPATRTYTLTTLAALANQRVVIPPFARRVWPQLVGGVTAQFRFTFEAENLADIAQYEYLNNANQSTLTRGQPVPVPPRAMYLLMSNVDAAIACTIGPLFELDL